MHNRIIIFTLLSIFAILIYYYIETYKYHNIELQRIQRIEAKIKMLKDEKFEEKLRTIPCLYENLTTPRDCYFHSKYKCKWNEKADRCNTIN